MSRAQPAAGHVEGQVRNFVTLGGDTHTSSVDDLLADPEGGSLVGTEFVAPPATSLESLHCVTTARLQPTHSPVRHHQQGYLRADARRVSTRADFRYVSTT
jgi:hypothetical protein